LGSSLYIEKNLDINHFDISVGGFGKTDKYCPPEILRITNGSEDEDLDYHIDLEKSISYLCGVTIAELTSLETDKNEKQNNNIESWLKIGGILQPKGRYSICASWRGRFW
jgi:hypothetical protein